MSDVVLINPPFFRTVPGDFGARFVPPGLVYIAGYLRKRGVSVSVVDADSLDIPVTAVPELVAAKRPAVVGITCDVTRVRETRQILAMVRAELPEALLVAGGFFPSFVPKALHPMADVVVKGEGERSFADLVTARLGGGPADGIPGLYMKNGDGYTYTGDAETLAPLEDYFFPAWDLFPMKRNYHLWARRMPIAPLVTSRGCPHRCAFCSIHRLTGGRRRQLGVDRVIEEVGRLTERFGVREIYFKDALFLKERSWMHDFCNRLLREGLDITWWCPTLPGYADLDTLRLMREAGCHTVNYGIESASPETLKRLRKPLTVERSLEAVRLARKAGLRVKAYFLVGLPWEGREDIEATLQLARRVKAHHTLIYLSTPYPGSELWDMCGCDESEVDWTDMHWFMRKTAYRGLDAQEVNRLRTAFVRSTHSPLALTRYALDSSLEEMTRQLRFHGKIYALRYGRARLRRNSKFPFATPFLPVR